jgi:4-diphosphocytidyl-2-C-methyl-D-erythritol kinase
MNPHRVTSKLLAFTLNSGTISSMIQRISPNQVLIRAPAKVNLFLHVLGRRSDGYHELNSLMLPVALYDVLVIETQPFGIKVNCPGHIDINDRMNLCHRAAEAYLKEIGWPIGVKIEIFKKIPLAAGLGGGSSDAAATLFALQYLLGSPLSSSEMLRLATRLGADVPFFLMGCPCLAQGIGEKLNPVLELPNVWLILACAPFELSTRKIFQHFDNSNEVSSILSKTKNRHTRQEWVEPTSPSRSNRTFKNQKIPLTSDPSDDRDLPAGCRFLQLVSHLKNDLQPNSESLHPEIGKMRDELMRSGAAGASMSGSGPTVFGVFRTRKAAWRARCCLRVKGWTYLVAKGITSAGRTLE